MKKLNLVGKIFGRLNVLKFSHSDGRCYWLCRCDCGNTIIVSGHNLKSGNTTACGCGRKGTNLMNKNGQWKGDKVGYCALHAWVKRHFPKPELCECGKRKPYDIANISPTYNKETYNRDLNNWEWLCRKCHMEKDGRMKNLFRWEKTKPRNCPICNKIYIKQTKVMTCSRKCGRKLMRQKIDFKKRCKNILVKL